MRRITSKLFIIMTIALVVLLTVEILSLNDETSSAIAKIFGCEEYIENGSGYDEIGRYIRGAESVDGTDCLIIGDSISRQFFSEIPHDDNVSIQCSNAAICVVGQYMLAMKWLDTHPNAKEIYLFMHPTSLTRTYDTEWTYPYVVIPFGLYDLMGYLDYDTIKNMESVYGRLFMRKSVVELINDSPLNRKLYLNYIKKHREDYVQQYSFEISEEYIVKLKNECEKRNVKFYLMPTPSSDYQKATIDGMRDDYNKSSLAEIFPGYLSDILYFSNEYSNDYQHLAPEYATREFMNEILQDAYGDKIASFYSKSGE